MARLCFVQAPAETRLLVAGQEWPADAARTLNVDVDGEMCVDEAHLVLVALGHTRDHVLRQDRNGGDSCGSSRREAISAAPAATPFL